MQYHRLIADLIRFPWAILESYKPLLSGVLARIFADAPLSGSDMERVRESRREWDTRHVALPDSSAREARPYTLVRGTGSSGDIAILEMYGILSQRGGMNADTSEPLTSTARLAQSVQLAASDPQISAVIIDVDTPGGSVHGTQELADAIYAARQEKLVVAVCNSLMASAGFWAASQASEVYCAPGGECGSIGVFTIHANVAELLRQKGISLELISAGKYKTETNEYGPLGGEARAYVQSTVDSYYASFVRAVARGRGTSLKAVSGGMGQGRLLQADQAKAEGMIDGTLTLAQTISKIAARAKRSVSARATMQRETDRLAAGGTITPRRLTAAAMQRELAILENS